MNSEWFNINKTLPPNGIPILTWDGNKRCIDIFENGKSNNLVFAELVGSIDGSEERKRITHWCYLPEPPK